MVKPLANGFVILYRIGILLIAFWLLNVFFVACHEAGHALVATAFGAKVLDIYINPLGLSGATTHTVLPVYYQSDLVVCAGVISTTVITILAFAARQELAVYVLALRTIESLINYSAGSDMAVMLDKFGYGTLAISAALVCIIVLMVSTTFYRCRITRNIAKIQVRNPNPT